MANALEETIKRKYSSLTVSQKKIAEYVLGHPEEVAFLSSKSLGEKVGVSDATVIRFSTALGVSGFSELQEILQSWLKGKVTPSEKLSSTRTNGKSTDRIYSEIFKSSIKNILKTREETPSSKIKEAISALDRAKKIFVLGLRRSHSIAFHLYYNLSHILNNVVLVNTAYGLRYDQIVGIGNQDVLIAISFPRYAKATAEIAALARRRGVLIIAVTDHPLSPVAQIADISLYARHESPFFFGSLVSAFVIADCMTGGLSLRHKRKYVKTLKKFEDTLRQFGVWLD